MNITLETLVQIIAIISFGAAVINYSVVKPLRDSVDTLRSSLKCLENLLNEVKAKEITLEQRVEFNVTAIEKVNKRVDALEKYHQKPVDE